VKHQVTDNVALMAGYNYGKTPVKASETSVNVLAPATVENHVSLGTEVKVSKKSKIIASYVRAFEKKVTGTGVSPMALDSYDLKMDQNAVGIAFSHEF
jgi:long-chain fatty acid transport protein